MTRNRPSLDDARAAFPHLGFAVYAFEPGQPVTLEIHAADGQVFAFSGPTLHACLMRAFPQPEPQPVPNVFD